MLVMVTKQLQEKGVKLEVTEAARDLLGEKGYDEVYGARPLRRAIQDLLEDKLSDGLLRGEFGSGDTITVDATDDEIVLHLPAVGALSGESEK